MQGGKPFPKHSEGPTSGAYVIEHEEGLYIGSTGNLYERKANHESALRRGVSPNKPLQEAFRRKPDVTFQCFPTNTPEEAVALEQQLLDVSKGNPYLFNIATDAEKAALGVRRSEEVKKKLSEHRTGMKLSPEHIEKVRLANTGQKRPPEFGLRMSALNKGRPRTETQLAVMLKHNEQQAKKISIQGVVYNSVKEASRITGVNHSTLRQRANSTNSFDDHFFVNPE